jgi:hypothetical protein
MRKLIKLLFFSFILFPGSGSILQGHEIPPPIVSAVKTGNYRNDIERIRVLLEGKNLKDFYRELDLLKEKISKNIDLQKNEESRLATLEWIYYFVAKSPLVVNTEHRDNDFTAQDAERIKQFVEIRLGGMTSLRKEDTKSVASLLSVSEGKLTSVHAIYFSEYLESILTIKNMLLKAQAIDKEKRRKLPEEMPEFSSEEEDVSEMRKFTEIDNRIARRSRFISRYNTVIKMREKTYIEKLVQGFPSNAVFVLENLKKIGYTTDMDCAIFIQRTIGRSKKTDYLFRNLPAEKKINEYFQKAKKEKIEARLKALVEWSPLEVRGKAGKRFDEVLQKIRRPETTISDAEKIYNSFREELQKLKDTNKSEANSQGSYKVAPAGQAK